MKMPTTVNDASGTTRLVPGTGDDAKIIDPGAAFQDLADQFKQRQA